MSFEVRVPGKWILAGEHSVIRGAPALVFPLWSRSLSLQFKNSPEFLKVHLEGEHGEELQLLFWGVLEKACEITKIQRNEIRGEVRLRNSIPIGAGLGASAALCVAVGKWFHSMKLVSENGIYEFSRTLENLFHGESSGVDIAVAISGKPLKFVRNGERTVLEPQWQPNWYVSYTGKRGVTSECVAQVKAFINQNPELGTQIDLDMTRAVEMAEKALMTDEKEGFPMMVEAIALAQSCFKRWGLCVDSHLKWLTDGGAVAVKPTGSGGGGYALSLWDVKPSSEVLKVLVPANDLSTMSK